MSAQDDAVAAHQAAVLAADVALFQAGVSSVPASPGGFSQADLDAAVAASQAELQGQVNNLMGQLANDDAKLAQIKALLG